MRTQKLPSPEKKLFPSIQVSDDEFSRFVQKELSKMQSLLAEKNRMYGSASMNLGMIGVYVHLFDKVARLRSFIEKINAGENLSFEGIEDTLRDTIGYATIGLFIQSKLGNSDVLDSEEISEQPENYANPPDEIVNNQLMLKDMKQSHDKQLKSRGTSFAQNYDAAGNPL